MQRSEVLETVRDTTKSKPPQNEANCSTEAPKVQNLVDIYGR